MSDLHTGERIHGGYFIAGPSIHAVGDVHPFTKVSVIYSNKVALQVSMNRCLNDKCFAFFTCHHLEMFSLLSPGKRIAPLSSSKEEAHRPGMRYVAT